MKKIILWILIMVIGVGLFFWKREANYIGKEIINENMIELTGIIEKMGEEGDFYRYYLKLDEPFVDETESGPAMSYVEIPLMVNQANWEGKEEILEERLGKKISIKGEIEWGQGETRHFLMSEVEGVKL